MDPLASLSPVSPPNMTIIELSNFLKKRGAKATGSKKELLRPWVLTRFLQWPNYRSLCTSRDPYYSHKKNFFSKKKAVKNIFIIYIYKMYCKSVGDPCDPLSVPQPTTKYAATQFWVATHGLRTQGLDYMPFIKMSRNSRNSGPKKKMTWKRRGNSLMCHRTGKLVYQ